MSAQPIDVRLLDLLLRSESPRTPADLARRLHGSAVSVSAALERLRLAGCLFESHPQQGVRLISAGLNCWADHIEPRHRGHIGRKLSVYRQTTSTQDVARRLLGKRPSAQHGHVVVADQQTAGRGRLGRRWQSSPGSALLLTAIVPAAASLDRLMLACCCALARAIEHCTPVRPTIRWPNDLLVDGAKLAGILVETVGRTALIGIGVNVTDHPADPRIAGGATDLSRHGPPPDRLLLLDELLTRLDGALHESDDAELASQWRDRASLWRQRVTVRTDGRRLTGRVIDIDPVRGLLMEVERGPVAMLPAATTSLVLD
jgi:BirA family biotin operon repressor/biotin-[acetyl-CoA-carboxylase] ligase